MSSKACGKTVEIRPINIERILSNADSEATQAINLLSNVAGHEHVTAQSSPTQIEHIQSHTQGDVVCVNKEAYTRVQFIRPTAAPIPVQNGSSPQRIKEARTITTDDTNGCIYNEMKVI